jgi:hypothetical protein
LNIQVNRLGLQLAQARLQLPLQSSDGIDQATQSDHHIAHIFFELFDSVHADR